MNNKKLISISRAASYLGLKNTAGKPSSHTLRFWEKKFKQINPIKINNQRYYSEKQLKLIKLIKYLLKDQKLTINGVKKILGKNIYSIDDYNSSSVLKDYYKKNILEKTQKILERVRKLKKNGKKNTH